MKEESKLDKRIDLEVWKEVLAGMRRYLHYTDLQGMGCWALAGLARTEEMAEMRLRIDCLFD